MDSITTSEQLQTTAKSQNKSAFGEPEADPNSELTTTVEQIEGTPFQKRWIKNTGWAFGMGTKRLTEWKETEAEMLEELKEINWRLITAVIDIITDEKMEIMKYELKKEMNNGDN